MSDETHVLDLLPAYVLDSLDAEEADRVADHLLSCLICRNEASTFRAATEQLSLAAPVAVPPPELKNRLMERVRSVHLSQPSRPAPGQVGWRRLLPVWGLASFGLTLLLGALSLSLWLRLDRLEYVTTPGGMRAIALQATDQLPGATGFVLMDKDGSDGALVVDGLPPLGEDQQYQLWLIREGQMTSGAVFSTDESTYGGMRIRASASLLDYSAVGITIEPAGGSLQPSGDLVLGGPLFNP